MNSLIESCRLVRVVRFEREEGMRPVNLLLAKAEVFHGGELAADVGGNAAMELVPFHVEGLQRQQIVHGERERAAELVHGEVQGPEAGEVGEPLLG